MTALHCTQDDAATRIRDHIPFIASSLSGIEGNTTTSTGDLPDDLADLYILHHQIHGITFTVLSYNTPIAWYIDGTWMVVLNRFSLTTTNHQAVVRNALCGHGPGWWGEYDPEQGRLLPHPNRPPNLFQTGKAVEVGEYERAVPAGTYGPREGW